MVWKYRSAAIVASALIICMAAVSGAAANVFPTISTSLTHGNVDIVDVSGTDTIMTTGLTGDASLGAHADLNVDIAFKYGATGLTGSGDEDPKTYPPGTDYRETAKSLVVETPPGLVGNPNAIPFDERCDPAVFETGECPDSATVGDIWISYSLMFGPQASPSVLNIIPIGPIWRSGYTAGLGWTKVSLLRTSPEVPAQIGVRVFGPLNIGEDVRIKLGINPVTSEDLRLRTVTIDDMPKQVWNGNTDEWQDIRLERMLVRFHGTLPNGHAFMTSSTSCQPWTTRAWANAHYGNTNADSNPLGGANEYVAAAPSTIDPECANAAAVPFPITGKVAIDTPKRDYSPAFDFTITNPGVQGDGQASTTPKKIVTTIPAAINVDVQQLGRTCTLTDFNADSCAPGSRVGSVKIETPLIAAGLTGDVYLVKRNATAGLPDLGLRVRGAITFTQLGSNRYVGARNNQIETTFDNIPQVGFSKLTFHLDGGPQGLLRSLACPTFNKTPALPTFTYDFFAYTGATATVTTPLNMANCFGIQTLKKYKRCLRKKLPVHPNYQSRTRVKHVVLKIDGKRKATVKKPPFRFDLKIAKLKLKAKKKHRLDLRATYDDGTISKKSVTFRLCK